MAVAENVNETSCSDCTESNNPCTNTGISTLVWDLAVGTCQQGLGISNGMAFSSVMNLITQAICNLQTALSESRTCNSILVPTSYTCMQFSGTSSTTLCDWMMSVNNRFCDLLDWNGDSKVFASSPGEQDLSDIIQSMINKLTDDLYTTNEWLFLPIAGNNSSCLQQSFIMGGNTQISWNTVPIVGNPYVIGANNSTLGLELYGGKTAGAHYNAVGFSTPTYQTLSEHKNFSVLTAVSTTLDQDTMKPIYFVDKSTVNAVYLPASSTMNITKPMVTFSATTYGAVAANCKVYPSSGSGDTVQGGASEDLSRINSVVLILDGSNWRIVQAVSF